MLNAHFDTQEQPDSHNEINAVLNHCVKEIKQTKGVIAKGITTSV